ncbi:MAG: C39 family peptidase [Clostridia bacterium]|nr:C39 family peptidase [Clostridia bacterium]
MTRKALKILALLMAICFVVCSLPIITATADNLTVEIDSINGSKSVSGSYIWTTGTFDATYWVAVEASYVSYNVYKVSAIYPSGSKSVTVGTNKILLVVHTSHAQFSNASQIALGDYLTLYNINLSTGTCNNGYVSVSSSFGLTISSDSALEIDYSAKEIGGIGIGSTVDALKTHICEATDGIVVKDTKGQEVKGSTQLGTGFTVQTESSDAYKLLVSGDLDGNAVVDSTDYIIVADGLMTGKLDITSKEGDVNGDGVVNSTDVIVIDATVAGIGGSMVAALPTLDKKEPEEIVVPPKTLHYRATTFKPSEVTGTHSGTVLSNGVLTLASGSTSGTFTTDTINIGSFTKMVASWNATTNGGIVNMSVSYELTTGAWSPYMSWGDWSSTRGVSGSESPSNTYGETEVDYLWVASGYTTTGNIKIRLKLTKYNGGTPIIRNFSVATPEMPKKQTVNASALPTSYLNEVPMRSQLSSANGSIGNIICSPTSTAMALEHLGTYVTSLTAAYDMYDNDWGEYGNWSFAAAYAGEKGYYAFIDFYDPTMMKYALSQGVVLGCATSLTAAGHIVLVVGYKEVNGVGYYLVNDPNISPSNPVRTTYSASYFESTWLVSSRNNQGLVYVFQGVEDLNNR